MKAGISLAAALLVVLLGAWVIARYELSDRVSKVAQGAAKLCRAGRDGQAPSVEDLAGGLARLAQARDLTTAEVRVTTEPVRPGQGQGAAADIQGQLSAMTGGKLKMEATFVRFDARLQGDKWLWSVDRQIEGSCIVRGKVERVGP
ncbi:MAG: hypothetical protein PVI30_20715 [Myxococcales bacterium]|jgi:hypothetical protein